MGGIVMGLFDKNASRGQQAVSQRQRMESWYGQARHNILLVLLFTAVNIVLLLVNSDTYFLFSAYIPYMIVSMGMFMCGRFPAEYYGDLSEYKFFDTSVLTIAVVLAAVLCALYLLCWLLSKKGRGVWMIIALVLFCLDTVLMLLGGIGSESISDLIFHGWVIISLSLGTYAHFKLKRLSAEEPVLGVIQE